MEEINNNTSTVVTFLTLLFMFMCYIKVAASNPFFLGHVQLRPILALLLPYR